MSCPKNVDTYRLGFGIFLVDSGKYQLQKLDDPEEIEDSYEIKVERNFESDDEACEMVQLLANEGNVVCRKTIEFLISTKSEGFQFKKRW